MRTTIESYKNIFLASLWILFGAYVSNTPTPSTEDLKYCPNKYYPGVAIFLQVRNFRTLRMFEWFKFFLELFHLHQYNAVQIWSCSWRLKKLFKPNKCLTVSVSFVLFLQYSQAHMNCIVHRWFFAALRCEFNAHDNIRWLHIYYSWKSILITDH